MDSDLAPSPSQTFDDLAQRVKRLQASVTEQQRQLMGAKEQQAKRVALHTSGDLVRQILAIQSDMGQLGKALEQQVGEQRQLNVLQEVSRVINSSLDLDVVLQKVMDAIIQLTDAERAMLLLYGADHELRVTIARNMDQTTLDSEASSEISRSVVRHVAETGEPVVTVNAQEDERFAAQDSIVSYKLRSILCVPLRIKQEIIGVIYADNRVAGGIFGDGERDALLAFADQAAVAIENARLFNEVADMKDLMDSVFASIAGGVITIDGSGRIALFNKAAERLLGVAASDVLEREMADVFERLELPIAEVVAEVKASGTTRQIDLELDGKGTPGASSLSLTLSPLHTARDEELGGVAIVLDDVSEKKRVESLRRYLPPQFVDQVRDLDAAQRPQRRTITVLFADIRSFSTIGEHLDPEELIHLANGFFTEAVAAISAHQGLIDKFVGDAVMALFNTPLNPSEDHVEQAVRAALDVQNNVRRFRASLPQEEVLHFGIGIHTGEAVVGNVGSEQRKDYSAIGDVVNLTKRLQEMAGFDQILASSAVYAEVDSWVLAEPLPPLQVKGRKTWEEVYQLIGERDDAGDAARAGQGESRRS